MIFYPFHSARVFRTGASKLKVGEKLQRMEFEMDIPAAEELEWLESNSLLPEYEEEEYIAVEDEKVAGSKESDLSKFQDPDPIHEKEIQRKRVRSEQKESDGASRKMISNEEERGNKRRELDDGGDEDWLRYSPPQQQPEEAAADVATESDQPMSVEVAEEKIISRFISEIEGDCMPVTGPGGDRVYTKMSSGLAVGGPRRLHREKSANGLLSEPIQALINEVEQEVLKKALQESFESPNQTKHSTVPLMTEQLWVDKYAPNSFTDLLSDEQTNREVLLWLKKWDACVFGSQIRATTEDVFSALRQHSSVQHQKFSDNKSFFNKNRAASFIDQNLKSSIVVDKENDYLNGVSELRSKKNTVDCPPEQKVLLLCGPPGLGKTTLAHVVAKHCGYRVVEINASDERSSSTIESKILDVVQMNSVMADSKPKCLVIDEIDGALGEGKGAVDVILKMVAAEKKSSVEKGNSSHEAQLGKAPLKKAKRHSATLLRPVICICNDLYAPALRSLRQVAKVHMFVQPTTSRVVNRLKYICQKEGFKTSSIALSALAEFTECDIRSCLNTLQFLNKKKEALDFLEVDSQVVGRKDMSRSAFDVWKEIFQKRKSKRGRKTKSVSSDYADFDFLYSLISNRGEYELTMDGIYENFLRLSYHDPMMQKTVRCLDALGASDSILRYILRTQQMSLYAYQPPIAIIMRNLIAQFEKPNIEWPKSLQKCQAMLLERKDTIRIWHNKIPPSISRHLSVEYFVEDLISPLLHIISPTTLRPVAFHLLTEGEKNNLSQLVDTMVSYSITYKASMPEHLQKFQNHGAVSDVSQLSFDPPIDQFVRFQNHQSQHFGLSLAVKQVLLHEVEKQRILRESIGKSTNQSEGINSRSQASPRADKKRTTDVTFAEGTQGSSQCKMVFNQGQNVASTSLNSFSETKKSFPANGMSSKAPENVKKPIRSSSSFFDKFRKGSGKDSRGQGEILQKVATIERDSRPFLFKYNEGFTNAVKRPVKIRELLL